MFQRVALHKIHLNSYLFSLHTIGFVVETLLEKQAFTKYE